MQPRTEHEKLQVGLEGETQLVNTCSILCGNTPCAVGGILSPKKIHASSNSWYP